MKEPLYPQTQNSNLLVLPNVSLKKEKKY